MKRPTGSPVFDDLLDGGYESGIITTVYGPSGSGKSNLMHLALSTVTGSAIFIDTEASFSVERLQQLAPDAVDLLDKIIVLRAHDLEQMSVIVDKLMSMVRPDCEFIVIDGIAAQYRAALARSDEGVNNMLSQQVNGLFRVAAEKNIPVLMTSQVYADFEKEGVKVVGGDIVRYNSKCMIELLHGEERVAKLIKHRSLPAKEVSFVIDNVGIYEKE